MEPIDSNSTVIELMDWLKARELESQRWMEMMKMLRYDPEPVVEIAEKLYNEGWDDTVESLVLAARLLAGNNV